MAPIVGHRPFVDSESSLFSLDEDRMRRRVTLSNFVVMYTYSQHSTNIATLSTQNSQRRTRHASKHNERMTYDNSETMVNSTLEDVPPEWDINVLNRVQRA